MALAWPLFRMPRNSSLFLMKVSPSSIRSVGRAACTVRNSAAAVIFTAGSGRGTMRLKMVSAVVFPHRFSGEIIAKRGVTWNKSKACA